jgi:poly(A) polymerase
VKTLAKYFDEANQELFLVGGTVRDALLGITTNDYDFATSAQPDQTIKILETTPGVESIYRIGEKFGTIGCYYGDCKVEITTYRTEVYDNDRKPIVTFGATLEDDLSRRDFTINAIAQNLLTGEVIDPFRGMDDIRDGYIRAVGNPKKRFSEDPLRLLRAVRFASRFGYGITESTLSELQAMAPVIATISRERIADEWTKIILMGEVAVRCGLNLLKETKLLDHSIPDLTELYDVRSQGQFHTKNLWWHTLDVVSGVEAKPLLRWAALLHDIGKPKTRTITDGEVHYYQHEHVGAKMARKVLRDLRFPNHFIDDVYTLIDNHMQINFYTKDWRDASVRRLMLALGNLMYDGIALGKSDIKAHKRGLSASVYDLERRVQELSEEKPVVKLPLDGNDLMAHFNRPPGPWIKHIKEVLLEAQIENGELDKEAALRLAEQAILEYE